MPHRFKSNFGHVWKMFERFVTFQTEMEGSQTFRDAFKIRKGVKYLWKHVWTMFERFVSVLKKLNGYKPFKDILENIEICIIISNQTIDV